MFVPTIKYKKVNETQDISNSISALSISGSTTTTEIKSQDDLKQNETAMKSASTKTEEKVEKPKEQSDDKKEEPVKQDYSFSFEEEEEDDATIEVDPEDKERVIITLSTGKKYSADRYCPHAGADLSYLGKVGENDYPPEIGPIVMCTLHYWEFALEREGKGSGGMATINACPVEVAEKCAASKANKKLDW